MISQKIQLKHKSAEGCVIPLGPVNLVSAHTDVGMIGCGAFDIMALNAFDYPAVKVKGRQGPIAALEDLLEGEVKEVNTQAAARGIKVGMSGLDALELL